MVQVQADLTEYKVAVRFVAPERELPSDQDLKLRRLPAVISLAVAAIPFICAVAGGMSTTKRCLLFAADPRSEFDPVADLTRRRSPSGELRD
jgi:hypothetical protein